MSVRQALQRHQKIVATVVCVVIVGAIVAIYAQVRPAPHPNVNLAYYSDDDGQTWFEDQVFKVTPFDHNGREAVGATLFDVGGKRYIGYLTRFSKTGVDIYQRLAPKLTGDTSVASVLGPLFADPSLHEVKLPGAGHPWVNMRDRAAMAIVTLPSSPSGDATIVPP